MDKILREKEVREMTGVTRATRWRWIKEGKFPRQIKLGENSIGWRLSDLELWIKERAEASGATGEKSWLPKGV